MTPDEARALAERLYEERGIAGIDLDVAASDALIALAAQLQTAQTLLQQVEWNAIDDRFESYCPSCLGRKPKHKLTCELATFLRGAEGTG